MKVKVVMSVEVDPALWVAAYGPAEVSVGEDVRRYVGGLVAAGEATRRRAIVGVDVKCKPVPPTDDY
jgi:hypothetical protein